MLSLDGQFKDFGSVASTAAELTAIQVALGFGHRPPDLNELGRKLQRGSV
jgi:hypothetical protein